MAKRKKGNNNISLLRLWSKTGNRSKRVNVPPKFSSLPIRVTGTFLSLARSLSWNRQRELRSINEKLLMKQQPHVQVKILPDESNSDLKKGGGGVYTTCLCCFWSVFLAFLALSMSSAVSRPAEELSWLKSLVFPENSWCDASMCDWSRLTLLLPPQVPWPPFTLPLKRGVKEAPTVEYLWTRAAVAPWTQTCCCLLNDSWMDRTWIKQVGVRWVSENGPPPHWTSTGSLTCCTFI